MYTSSFTSIIILILHIISYKQYAYYIADLEKSLTKISIYDLTNTTTIFEGESEYLINTTCVFQPALLLHTLTTAILILL